jgi:outer membrane protein assembly factor BamD (BamD/ComL family)
LIHDEKYEEALAQLEGVENARAVQAECEDLKRLAREGLINRERNRAAESFLLARNTKDPREKKELLLSSYKILKVLVDKYPASPLIEKVNDHIHKVREALAELGVRPE